MARRPAPTRVRAEVTLAGQRWLSLSGSRKRSRQWGLGRWTRAAFRTNGITDNKPKRGHRPSADTAVADLQS